MIFHKPFQELKIILYLSLVLLLSIYIHQGYEVYALDESIVYTFLIPILITHHVLHTYSFSKNHIKFYGLRTKEVYIQTWYLVLYKSFIDIVIWYVFTYVLFQHYMKLSHISVDIIYDFIYIHALSLIALSVTHHIKFGKIRSCQLIVLAVSVWKLRDEELPSVQCLLEA